MIQPDTTRTVWGKVREYIARVEVLKAALEMQRAPSPQPVAYAQYSGEKKESGADIYSGSSSPPPPPPSRLQICMGRLAEADSQAEAGNVSTALPIYTAAIEELMSIYQGEKHHSHNHKLYYTEQRFTDADRKCFNCSRWCCNTSIFFFLSLLL
jgi:hypothetical protein